MDLRLLENLEISRDKYSPELPDCADYPATYAPAWHHMPSLTKLKWEGCPRGAMDFIRHLDAPRLIHIDLHLRKGISWDEQQWLMFAEDPLIPSPLSSVRAMRLKLDPSCIPSGPAVIMGCHELLPNVEELSISAPNWGEPELELENWTNAILSSTIDGRMAFLRLRSLFLSCTLVDPMDHSEAKFWRRDFLTRSELDRKCLDQLELVQHLVERRQEYGALPLVLDRPLEQCFRVTEANPRYLGRFIRFEFGASCPQELEICAD